MLLTESMRVLNEVEMGGECGTRGGNSNGLEVKPKGKIPVCDLGVYWWMIVQWVLKKQAGST